MSNQEKVHIDDHVVAVVTGSQASEQLARELERHGFEHTHLFRGDDVAEKIDPKGERSGPVQKVVKLVQDHLSEETDYLKQYEEEALAGNEVIAVHVDNGEQAEAVKSILERYGARNVRYFGKLAVTDLSLTSNPTARSDEVPEATRKAGQG
jgi:hypothetical protein